MVHGVTRGRRPISRAWECGEGSVAFYARRPGAIGGMDTKEEVGGKAGEVWRLLELEGPLTVAQLKKKLDGNSEIVGFAIGWLAREDKLEILPEKKSFRLQLK